MDTTTPNGQSIVLLSGVITEERLRSIGVMLEGDELAALVQYAEDKVHQLVSEEIAESLGDDQVEELVQLQQNGASAEEIDAWLRERVEDYDQIIEDNVLIVLGELAKHADEFSK